MPDRIPDRQAEAAAMREVAISNRREAARLPVDSLIRGHFIRTAIAYELAVGEDSTSSPTRRADLCVLTGAELPAREEL